MAEEKFFRSLDNIPARLILELRRMSQEHMDPNMMDDPSLDFDPTSDRHSRAAMQILAGIPMAGGVMTGPETILSLVRNPESKENKEYILENRALLRAFPILKQIYGIEKESSLLDWNEFDKQTKERNLAIEDFSDMFGKDALPKELRSSLEDINRRKRELENKLIPIQKEWFKTARTSPLEADAETVKHIRLQKEIDRLAGSPYVQDAPTALSTDIEPDFKIKSDPMEADAEALKRIRLQEESDKLKRGYETTPVSFVGQGSVIDEGDSELEADPVSFVGQGSVIDEGEIGADELDARAEIGRRGAKGYPDRASNRAFVDADTSVEDAYELPETDLEKDWLERDAYTIEKDVAITEALEAADYDKVKRIEDAYKNYEPIPTDDTDDWSYMGKAMHRYQEGGVVGYAHGGSAEKQLTEPVIPHPDVTLDTSLPTENVGFVGTPNGAADDQTEAAKNGEMGGDKVDENLPEGSFVLNSYAVELAGIKDIEKLIDDAKKYMLVQTGESGFVSPTGEDVEVRVSEGEYIIPPSLVRIIGRDRLEKINNRGIVEFERQQAEEIEMGGEEMPQEPRGYMPQEGEAPMPPEGGAPMPPQDTEPMPPEQVPQGFARGTVGGGVQQQGIGGNSPQSIQPTQIQQAQQQGVTGPEIGITNETLQMALKAKLPSDEKPKQHRVAQASQPKAVQPTRPPIGRQSPSPLARVNPLAPGVPNLQKNPNIRMANMGGFMPYSRNG